MNPALRYWYVIPRRGMLRIAATALLVALPMAAGCVAVAAGAAAGYAGYEYTNGEVIGVVGANVGRTYQATVAALESQRMVIKARSRESTLAELTAVEEDGTDVDIVLTRQSPDFTRITIRVGLFGDAARSRQILDLIKERL
jgi:hypothetical protein